LRKRKRKRKDPDLFVGQKKEFSGRGAQLLYGSGREGEGTPLLGKRKC